MVSIFKLLYWLSLIKTINHEEDIYFINDNFHTKNINELFFEI